MSAGIVLKNDLRLRRFDDLRELIGSRDYPTPLVRIRRVAPTDEFGLYLKLEWFNPFGLCSRIR